MKSFQTETPIRDFLNAIASAEEAHGAVSAAAVSGAIGTSLLMMVAALPHTRFDSVEDRTRLLEAGTALADVQAQLLEAVETETAVKVFAARNMPQASANQRAQRLASLQIALRAAADVPLEVMRLCARGLRQAERLAAHSSRAAAADVQLGIALVQAAFIGARAKLEDKITSLTDTQYVTAVIDEVARLSEESAQAAQSAEAFLQVPPA